MRRFALCAVLIFWIAGGYAQSGNASAIPCKKKAEAFALLKSREKGNLPAYLLSTAHPTEMEGGDVVVYIGAWATYNYFKLKFDARCRFIKTEDADYARSPGDP